MREIKEIVAFINEEMEGLEDYIHYAAKTKGINDLAYQTALKIIAQEFEHIDSWHLVAVKTIETKKAQLKAAGKEAPEYMQEMWNDEHKDYVEKLAKLKYKFDIAKK